MNVNKVSSKVLKKIFIIEKKNDYIQIYSIFYFSICFHDIKY